MFITMTMSRRACLPILASLLLLLGCSPANERADLTERLSQTVQSAAIGDLISINAVTDVTFDKMTVFSGYTPNDDARELLGFDWDVESTPGWANDSDQVVVLSENEHVSAWFTVTPSQADFGIESTFLQLPSDRATFRVGLGENGRRILVPGP